jgi:hypothetical protein
MKCIRHCSLASLLLLCGWLSGCNPEVDVYAPEKEIYAIYGVLEPALDTQYVRIGKVYQSRAAADTYGHNNDLSAPDLAVTVEGADTTFEAFLDLAQPKDSGTFDPRMSLYAFLTPPGHKLQPGAEYTLHVRHPDDDSLHITATTRIPYNPRIVSPGPYIYSAQSQRYTFNSVEFNSDASFTFEKGAEEGYEWRVWVRYWDGEKMAEYRWGPSRILFESSGCPGNPFYNRYCYKVPGKSVPYSMRGVVERSPGTPMMMDTVRTARSLAALSKDTRLELTVVDKHLALYLYGVSPFGFGLNLLIDKDNHTNISGGHAGIFGSIQRVHHYIFLGGCTLYIAGLTPQQPSFCE